MRDTQTAAASTGSAEPAGRSAPSATTAAAAEVGVGAGEAVLTRGADERGEVGHTGAGAAYGPLEAHARQVRAADQRRTAQPGAAPGPVGRGAREAGGEPQGAVLAAAGEGAGDGGDPGVRAAVAQRDEQSVVEIFGRQRGHLYPIRTVRTVRTHP